MSPDDSPHGTYCLCPYVSTYVCMSVFCTNIILMLNRKQNSVKIKFAYTASILRHLESKCCIHLESLIFFPLIFQIASIFIFNVEIFSTFSHLFTYRGIFTSEGATHTANQILQVNFCFTFYHQFGTNGQSIYLKITTRNQFRKHVKSTLVSGILHKYFLQ